MRKMKEIQVVIDDFRVDVIKAILSAFPGRAVDDEDPSNDTFLIDGVPVRLEADRIVVGDDLDNYISLKDAPVGGQPPRYRDIDSILVDFTAYINKEKADSLMETTITQETQIPGTNIVLEKGDKLFYSRGVSMNENFTGAVAALMRALSKEGWDVDSSYQYDATFRMGNIFVTVHDDGRVNVRDAYDAKGFLINTDVKNFARDYGKIIDKYLKSRYDYGRYRYNHPDVLEL